MTDVQARVAATLATEAILRAVPGDDAEARFRGLAGSELRRSYRLAGLLLGGSSDAEDAVQDALLRAWQQLDHLRDTDHFQAWFDRILVNVCRDRLRRGQRIRFVPIADDDEAGRPVDPFRAIVDRDPVLRATRELDVDARTVIVLHYWADLTLDEVARRTGLPVGTVKTRLHRALGTMRTTLDNPTGGER